MGRRYLETELRTATPMQLVVRLYAAALRHTEAAIEADGAGRIAERGERISRVIAIVGELRSAVDFERGGEIAQNLEALYDFVGERLVEAGRGDAASTLSEVLSVLRPLHDAWTEVEKLPAVAEEPGA